MSTRIIARVIGGVLVAVAVGMMSGWTAVESEAPSGPGNGVHLRPVPYGRSAMADLQGRVTNAAPGLVRPEARVTSPAPGLFRPQARVESPGTEHRMTGDAYPVTSRLSDVASGDGPLWVKRPQGVAANPTFAARPAWDQVWGEEWPEGASVTLTINDLGTPDPVDYSDKQTVVPAPWDPSQTFVPFEFQGLFDLQAGHVVTMSDGVTAKTHTVTNLVVTGVDPDADTVSGTADPGTDVDVWIHGGPSRHEVADGGGAWTADFSTSGDEPGEEDTYDIGPGTDGNTGQFDGDDDSTGAWWRVPNPYFWARPAHDQVEGREWPEGANVSLIVNDPDTPEFPDYSDKKTVIVAPWDPGQTYVSFQFQGVFDMEPGHVVTLTDGVTAKTHIVTELAVTEVDPDADTVSGTADPGTDVSVQVCDESGCVERYEVADGGSAWTADFSTPGDEPGEEDTYDIVPGTEGDTEQRDDDDDGTRVRWRVRNPYFAAWPAGTWSDQVHGYDWPEGVKVTLTIDDPGTPESPDYTDKQTVVPAPWDPQQTFVPFQLEGLFDLEPGHVITLTDGITTKEHIVTNLTVTSADPDADTVSGTADPGTDVGVQVCDESGCVWRYEVADGGGQWTADFSTPGGDPGEEDTYDIGPGTEGDAEQRDEDEDATRLRWRVPNPGLEAWPWPGQDRVEGWEWPEGASVTLTIDDPDTPELVDYTDKQTVIVFPWDPQQTFVRFELRGLFDLEAGHIVTLTDGVTTKDHIVTNLAVTAVDPDADTVSGTAEPGSHVDVWICDESGCVERHEVADGEDAWTADFSTPGNEDFEQDTYDIGPGTEGGARQHDDDWDSTAVSWQVPDPTFAVWPAQDSVAGWEWPEGAKVTLTVGASEPWECSVNQTVSEDGNVSFDLQELCDIQPGHIVTLSDGVTAKTHTVTNLTVTGADPDADTVSGTAEPGTDVDVWICDESDCVGRHEVADGGDEWTADFSTPGDEPGEEDTYDIGPGTNGNTGQFDEDGDWTGADWRVPNPAFSVRLSENQVHGYEWPEGAEVTLTIDDLGTPESPDYIDTQTVFSNPCCGTLVVFDLQGAFDVQPADLVTLTDGVTTKEHFVTNLTVTAVDPDADTVSGTADAATDVDVWICDAGGCVGRHEVADGEDQWTADFSTQGDEPGEEDTYDIGPGTQGNAGQFDDDDDWTGADWRVPNPAFSVRLSENQVHGYEWPEGAEVTLTIDDLGTPESPDYTDTQTVFSNPCCGTLVVFDLQGAFDVQPADLVTLTDGITTKEHIVTNLAVTAVDPDADTVTGTADPGTDVGVQVCDESGCVWRYEVADGGGAWTADFSTPGDEPGEEDTYDIVPGTEGAAGQWDDDGDLTSVRWEVGWINGTVTEEGTGTPLPGIEACVYRNPDGPGPPWDFFVGCDTTDASGAYSVGNLGAGDYKVQFSDPSGTYAFEWYENKPDFDSADLVPVAEGVKTEGVHAALALGGSINGTVTVAGTSTPLADICVNVTDASNFWPWVGSDVTDGSGAYSVGGLRSGDYKVEFQDCGSPVAYISEWYDDKANFESADLVPVGGPGSKTSGIDAALTLGGSINGTVTEEGTGTPLADVCVTVYHPSWDWAGSGYTDASGTYTVGALPTGDYKVEFRNCTPAVNPYAGEWYNDKPDFDSADLVPVTVGVKTGGIGAVLAVSTEKHDVESLDLTGSTSTPGKVPQTYTATVRNNSPVPENVQIALSAGDPLLDPETITLEPGDLPPGSTIVVGPFVFNNRMVMVISVPLDPGQAADVPVVVTFPNGYTAADVGTDVCHEGDPPDGDGRGFSEAGVSCTGGSDGYLDVDPANDAWRSITVTEGPTPTPQGDVTCDDPPAVNVVDALFILQYEVGLRVDIGGCPLPPDTLNAAGGDVNKDESTNVVDALFILQCEVGLKPGANMPFCTG